MTTREIREAQQPLLIPAQTDSSPPSSGSKTPKPAWKGVALAILYLIVGIALPLYNRALFGRKHALPSEHNYPHPLPGTFVQLIGVSTVLHTFTALRASKANSSPSVPDSDKPVSSSLSLGLSTKLRKLVLVAGLFAANISLSNLGLFYVPVNIHVLLRASETLFVVFFSYVFHGIRPSRGGVFAVTLLAVGIGLVGADYTGSSTAETSWFGVFLNVTSAVAASLHYVILRGACLTLEELFPTITIPEITAHKLSLSLIFILPASLLIDAQGYVALIDAQWYVVALLLGGIFVTLVYQASVVALASYTLALTVAVLGQLRLPIQVILGSLLFNEPLTSSAQVWGTIITIVASCYYGYLRYTSNEWTSDSSLRLKIPK